jgi:hypothetical protein
LPCFPPPTPIVLWRLRERGRLETLFRARPPVCAARLWRRSTVDLCQNGTVRVNGAQFHAADCARNNEVPMARKWGSSRGAQK